MDGLGRHDRLREQTRSARRVAMISLSTGAIGEIAVVGAHCDDIAIGMGGTLLAMSTAEPGLRVRCLVLTGSGTPREAEERAALEAFCPGADLRMVVSDI